MELWVDMSLSLLAEIKKGELIGLGGNQSNAVCYRTFNEDEFMEIVWSSIYLKQKRFNLPVIDEENKSKYEL